MSRKKLILSDEQKELIEELSLKGLSSYKIAKKLRVSQPTAYRSMEEMGLNRERKIVQREIPQEENFNWETFKRIMF